MKQKLPCYYCGDKTFNYRLVELRGVNKLPGVVKVKCKECEVKGK